MRITNSVAGILTLLLLASISTAQTPPSHDGKIAVFGSLHAHSTLSGDVKDAKGLTPLEAFTYARDNGLDFLGISDHHKPAGAPGAPRYSLSATDYENRLVAVANQLNTQHAGDFVAIPGFEWGTIATGNHINVFGSPRLPPDTIDDDDYNELYAWINANALFAQGNHPYGWASASNRNKQVGNYGRALFVDTEEFVSSADDALSLMSIICTVEGGHISGAHAPSQAKTHRDVHPKALREFRRHLDMGFHLSPSANQDTHGKNPGTVTAARTGVWVDSLTLVDITEGIKANRVFATEDDELAVAMQVRYNNKTYWMGETVPLAADEQDVLLVVMVSQTNDSNGDSASEGPYVATLYSDSDGIGGAKAAEWETFDIPANSNLLEVEVPVVAGEYFYLEVHELGGTDNPTGQGVDETSTDGSDGSDGIRDDLNDSAWTSPIWLALAPSGSPFVWSINSKIYHNSDCWAAKRIGAVNLRIGEAPEGKTKHDCHP
jgi:hypothetical protein